MRPSPPIIAEKIKTGRTFPDIYTELKAFPYSFFLDSALTSKDLGAFSFIGIEPFLIFKSKKDYITLDWPGRHEVRKGNPFLVLKELLKQFKIKSQGELQLPFTGGGVGYFSYDLKDFNERLPDKALDDVNVPDCIVCFYDTVLAYDHRRGDSFIVSSGFPERGRKRHYRQRARLESLKRRLSARTQECPGSVFVPGTKFNSTCPRVYKVIGDRLNGTSYLVQACHSRVRAENHPFLESNFTKDTYIDAVLKAKEYIKKGDIYQVNLSQRFKVNLDIEPYELYKVLRDINPAPFACFLNFGEVQVASASPERFLRVDGRKIETRPIKGTRPRGEDEAKDRALKSELLASAKDRAENLMIIDLERNDLGRISEYGSVKVSEFMTCEEYATVFHLVSTVQGKLKKDVDSADCLMNCFPGGSITGAPKIRSMEIIEELEPVKRSIYTGSIGYIGFDGNMDTSIVIRTFIIKGNNVYFQVGGGIVYDSDPEKEYQETLDKAKALIDATGVFKRQIPAFR